MTSGNSYSVLQREVAMDLRVLGLTALVLPLGACNGARGEETGDGKPVPATVAAIAAERSVPSPAPSAAPAESVLANPAMTDPSIADPALANRSLTRTIERDANNDGIPESRVFITETFDGSGRLASRTREIDRDADGIFDSKTVTEFGDY